MANLFDVGGYVKKNGYVVATLRLKGDGTLDVVVTADGTKTMLDLLKEVCSEVVAKQPPNDPLHPDPAWNELKVTPAAGTQVTLVLGMRAETKTPAP
jgi:hypothetical protein